MSLTKALLGWYKHNARALPWRTKYEAYHILISEVMLQQTQMERGIVYFNNWIEKFPTIFDVAQASEDEILKAWEGLGYYRRARYLHDTAKKIAYEHAGIVPNDKEILSTFKGLGDYTIAAICSIAYNQPLVSIDANVERVYARLFCIQGYTKAEPAKSKIRELAYAYLDPNNARLYNQALMELGALICKKKPECELCPLVEFCQAYKEDRQNEFPSPAPRREQIKEDWIQLIFITKDKKIALIQRENSLHWGGLFEFYSIQAKTKAQKAIILENLKDLGLKAKKIVKEELVPYVYTNHKNTLTFYRVEIDKDAKDLAYFLEGYHFIEIEELNNFAFPSPHCKAIKKIFG